MAIIITFEPYNQFAAYRFPCSDLIAILLADFSAKLIKLVHFNLISKSTRAQHFRQQIYKLPLESSKAHPNLLQFKDENW